MDGSGKHAPARRRRRLGLLYALVALVALAGSLLALPALPASAAPALPPAVSGVTARAVVLGAEVDWTPTAPSTPPVTSYLVTTSPGGAVTSVLGDLSATVISGLAPGTSYAFTVTAVAVDGPGEASTPTSAVVPLAPGGELHPLPPARVLDTRYGTGGVLGPVVAGSPVLLTVAGHGGVPSSGVTGVFLNVTATQGTADGYLTLFPADQPQPNASNVNFLAGQDVPNLVFVQLSPEGAVRIATAPRSVQVVADVVGWVGRPAAAGSSAVLHPLAPARVLDTRYGLGAARLTAGGTTTVVVAGRGGVPATGASAVVLNITVVNPSASGFLVAWPSGSARPHASNLNFPPGKNVANRVVVPLGAGGAIDLSSVSVTDVVADVGGYVADSSSTGEPGAYFVPVPPKRVLDTRSGLGGRAGRLGPGGEVRALVAGAGGVPRADADVPATAVIVNITAVDGSADSFLSAFPTGTSRPRASDVNFLAHSNVPNLAIAKLGSDGSISLYNDQGNVDVVVDVLGYALGDVSVSTAALAAPASSVVAVSGDAQGDREVVLSTDAPIAAVGDVLAVGVGDSTPDGLLGRVVSRAASGGDQTVTVAPATLDEVAPTGAFALDGRLSADDVVSGGDGRANPAPGAAHRRALTPQDLTARGTGTPVPLLQRLDKAVTCSASGSVSISGDVSVVPSFHADASWGGWRSPGIRAASFTGNVTASASVRAEAHAAAGCVLDRTPLLARPLRFTPIELQVGPLPVVLVPELQLYLSATGEIEADVVAEAAVSYTATAGLRWDGTTLSPVAGVTDTSSAVPPTPTADGHLSASVGPQLDLLLYGVAGPTISMTGTLTLSASSRATPWWTLTATLDAGGGIVLPALHFEKSKPDILHFSKVLAHATGPAPQAPLTVTTTDLQAGVLGRDYRSTLTATGGTGAFSWSVVEGSLPSGLDLSTGGIITGAPQAAGTSSFRVVVSDAGGHQVFADLAMTVVPPTVLTDYTTRPDFSCDAHEAGVGHSVFFGTSGTACGTFVRVDGQTYGPGLPASDVPGRRDITPLSSTETVNGTAHHITTVGRAGDTGVTVVQDDDYVESSSSWTTRIRVSSTSGTHNVSVFRGADCYIDDNDYSTGRDDPLAGSVSCDDQYHDLTFRPAQPQATHHEEAFYADVWQALGGADLLPDTARHDVHDSGMALQWVLTVDPAHGADVSSTSSFGVSPAQSVSRVRAALVRRTGRGATCPTGEAC